MKKFLEPHVRQNLWLGIVLAAAAYLSAASLSALPALLEDTKSAQTDVSQLRTLLEAPERQFHVVAGDLWRISPFDALSTALADKSNDGAHSRWKLDKWLSEHQSQRERLRVEYFNAVDYWSGAVNRARGIATVTFSQNADRKGNAERRQHYAALLNWYDWHLTEAQRELNECVRSFQSFDAEAKRWADRAAAALTRTAEVDDSPLGQPNALEQCMQRWQFADVPQRAELGTRYGPFRLIGAWLVQTESLSLVAIVGLAGFGLLGAAASTIVREQGAVRAAGQPLVSDLPSVIVRGLTAAIVVFLMVKGGLAVFSTDSPEPNPYVLLLTCLIAAIFSEPVFEGAQVYLRGLIGRWTAAPAQPVVPASVPVPVAAPPIPPPPPPLRP